MAELIDYLQHMVKHEGSDLYLTTDKPPIIRIDGILTPIDDQIIPPGRVREIAYELMDEDQIKCFEKSPEINLAISKKGIGRFRANIFQQRNQVAIVIRNIKINIPQPEELRLPAILKELIMEKSGLILFVGAAGSGKSTSLASLIDYRNSNSADHIITIEDPIEYVYKHKKSIVNQREVGVDTISYEEALKNTLRQSPDVILIGEIRTRATMEHAISFAETGHLCLSTLHSINADQAMDRIINFFPQEYHRQLLLDLSLNLRGIISQRLIPSTQNKRIATFEILLNTPLISDLIYRGEIRKLKEVMQESENSGMQTFDNSLHQLYKENLITLEEALRNADSKNNLRVKISLEEGKKNISEENVLTLQKKNPLF